MISQGRLIEYLDNGKFICAFVLENTGKRLRLLNQNGREVNLAPSRLVHCSEESYSINAPRAELLKQLKAVSEKRLSLMPSVNLAEIWELAAEEPDNLFAPRFLAELCFGGDATDDNVAALLRCIFADRLFFKYKGGKITAHPTEKVEQLRLRQEKERQKEELLNNGAAWLQTIWQGGKVDPADWRQCRMCLQLVEDYYLFGNDASQNDITRELLKRAGLGGPHDALYLLIKAGIWDKNENIPVLRKKIPTTFPEEVLEHIRSSTIFAEPSPASMIGRQRKDFRDLPLLTIDGRATRDFDDALHIEKQGENYLVGIHIADVAHYIKPDDPLFRTAFKRGTSIYFPEEVVPMLPKEISEDLCSLIAGQARPALSILVLLSPEGAVLEYDIKPSVVEVKRRLYYSESDLLMKDDEELNILGRLSRKLRERRIEAGALLLPFPDVNIHIGPDESITVNLAESDTPSRVLVSEFMILANTLGAQFITDRETPGLFRSQPPPYKRLVRGLDKDLFINTLQRKNLARGELLTRARPHSGVGATQYTTITSPIRRLLDLIMQHQIYHLITHGGALFSREELQRYAMTITATTAAANQARQLRHRYWILKYLESRIGERVDCLIIDKKHRRIQVLLVDFLLDADLPAAQGIAAPTGEIISIKIARVNALDNILRLEP